jgi:hypothetical protein
LLTVFTPSLTLSIGPISALVQKRTNAGAAELSAK